MEAIVNGSGFWFWLERLSWLVALAGFPLLIYQVRVLQRDQRNLAKALTRRPRIEFGFLKDSDENGESLVREIYAKPRWLAGSTVSEPLDLTMAGRNTGELTARSVLFNVKLPAEIASGISFDREGVGDVIRSPNGSIIKPIPITSLLPGVVQTIRIQVRIPARVTSLDIETRVNMDDSQEQYFALTVRLEPPQKGETTC
jgi:hypothetical protein